MGNCSCKTSDKTVFNLENRRHKDTSKLLEGDDDSNDDINDSRQSEFNAMSQQVVFLSTKNAHLEQELEEARQKLKQIEQQFKLSSSRNSQTYEVIDGLNNNNKDNNKHHDIDNNHLEKNKKSLDELDPELTSYLGWLTLTFINKKYEFEYNDHVNNKKTNDTYTNNLKKPTHTSQYSIGSMITNACHLEGKLTVEEEKQLRRFLTPEDIDIEKWLRTISEELINDEGSSYGLNYKILSRIVLTQAVIIIYIKSNQSSIKLDQVYQMAEKFGETRKTVDEIVSIVESEANLLSKFNEFY